MRSYFQGGVGQLQSKCVQGGRGVKKGPKIAFIIKVRSLLTNDNPGKYAYKMRYSQSHTLEDMSM